MRGIFYILYSQSSDKYYLGHTSETIEVRLRKHNSNHDGFTGNFNDWKCVYSENYENKALAYKREREVKSWKSRKRLIKFILGSEHPGS